MLVDAIEASAFGTNCWVVATGEGRDCLVVDPGVGVVAGLEALLRRRRLRPAAVLLTHAHADHVWSVAPVCRSAGDGVAVHVHPADRYRLADPLAQLAAPVAAMLAGVVGVGGRWERPEHVVALPQADAAVTLRLAGLELDVHHAPGHTEGSVVFHVQDTPRGDGAPAGARVLLSGDVLFAGSIGRSDLPGGDPAAMAATLREVLPRFDDDTDVLPGHGRRTTMAAERADNPFLQRLARTGSL